VTPIDPERTVAELVIERPGRVRVFEQLHIDFCCGGQRSLASACAERGLDPATVATMLAATEAASGGAAGGAEADWAEASLAALSEHIVGRHHAYLREELPRLGALVAKVARVHGDRHPALHETQDLFEAVATELLSHLAAEEETVFPACKQVETTGETGLANFEGVVAAMERDHLVTGAALERIRLLNDDFTPPPDACNSYRAMLAGLDELEHDVHRHIHKENNILFPRALALEHAG